MTSYIKQTNVVGEENNTNANGWAFIMSADLKFDIITFECVFFQSDNERVYAQHLQNKLYPDHTYSVVSGGEPLAIPDLTWEQLRQFHATHYHPSNAR